MSVLWELIEIFLLGSCAISMAKKMLDSLKG